MTMRSEQIRVESNVSIKKYAMVTTVFTPKLIDLLDFIRMQAQEDKLKKFLDEIVKNILETIADYRKDASVSSGINIDVFGMASSLYAIYDDAVVAASIMDKINALKILLTIFSSQDEGNAPYSVTICATSPFNRKGIKLTSAEIRNELSDYADELEAWLDEYFADEYDDYCAEDQGFDIIVKIMVDLRFLSKILTQNSKISE